MTATAWPHLKSQNQLGYSRMRLLKTDLGREEKARESWKREEIKSTEAREGGIRMLDGDRYRERLPWRG